MSKALRDKGQALAAEIWKQAKREATQAFAKERAASEADAADERQDREHLLGMIETLQAENAALADGANAAEGEAARVQARLARVENQLDRFRAMEF